ncbi:MAG: LrgB family protein [Burkholderiaceae bacterium]
MDLREIWVYLSGSPLFSLILTLVAYQLGVMAHQRAGRSPLVNPVAIAVAVTAGALLIIDMPYAQYFEGAQFIHFLLGTATVALAVPIAQGWHLLKGRFAELGLALLMGGLVSVVSSVGLARLLDVPTDLVTPMLAKSVTAPIAMGISESMGISPTLTAVYAVLTGVIGAIAATHLLNALGMKDWTARGFAVGVAAHGIGTSRAFAVHPDAGAFSSVGMGLHGVAGALFLPLVGPWLLKWLA